MNLFVRNVLAERSLWMPEAASTVAEDVDALFYFILYLSTFFFIGIVGAMLWFVFKYKKRSDNDKTSPVTHNTQLEIWWSILPTILLIVMFWWGFKGFMNMSVPPDGGLEIRVTARQWSWQFDYPRDGIVSDKLVVPANTPIKLTMSSSDVLHSFFVPEFRIKKDVLPNRYTVVWFEAPNPGVYNVFCAEYCGKDHSRMITRVEVLSQEDYQKWIDTGGGLGDMPLDELGAIFFTRYGCNQCHNVDGTPNTGPHLDGKYGTLESCTDGTEMLVDDNYLRESILSPGAKVVTGFQPKMPAFRGKIKEKQLVAIIEYIKSIGQDAPAPPPSGDGQE